jgi:hypothetical protein
MCLDIAKELSLFCFARAVFFSFLTFLLNQINGGRTANSIPA